jgi:hypothetical protein
MVLSGGVRVREPVECADSARAIAGAGERSVRDCALIEPWRSSAGGEAMLEVMADELMDDASVSAAKEDGACRIEVKRAPAPESLADKLPPGPTPAVDSEAPDATDEAAFHMATSGEDTCRESDLWLVSGSAPQSARGH